MGEIAEQVFVRYGLLGLAVLALIYFVPRWLDKMTNWAIKNAENEDRADERFASILAKELEGGRLEREAYRQEKEQYLAAIRTLEAKIALLDQRLADALAAIRNLTVLINDFDMRLGLYLKSRGEKS